MWEGFREGVERTKAPRSRDDVKKVRDAEIVLIGSGALGRVSVGVEWLIQLTIDSRMGDRVLFPNLLNTLHDPR